MRLCDSKACDLRLSLRSRGRDVLQLVPRIAVLGVGCRKGISAAALEDALTRLLAKAGVCPQAITMAASIDLKKEEPGLLEFCAAHGWPCGPIPPDSWRRCRATLLPVPLCRRSQGWITSANAQPCWGRAATLQQEERGQRGHHGPGFAALCPGLEMAG